MFDDTLRQALSVALNQSPFLNVLSETKVGETLKLMARPVNSPLTPEVAREVCQRADSKAFITGSINKLGSQYVLGLRAVNCQNGDLLTQEQATAATKEKVLDTVGQAAAKTRTQLGESLATVKRYDVPLAQATTSSLEALKAYSQGAEVVRQKEVSASLPHFERAIQLDPSFAAAYSAIASIYYGLAQTGRASEFMTKAFELRDHASEREKLSITARYNYLVLGDLDKTARAYLQLTESYPRDSSAHNFLCIVYAGQGQYEKAAAACRQSLQITTWGPPYGNLVNNFLALQRFEDARQTVREAQEHKVEDSLLHSGLYALAFLAKDSAGMADQQRWFSGGQNENPALSLAADTEAYRGHLHNARELTNRSVDSAKREDSVENGAVWLENAALREAFFGNSAESERLAAEGLKLFPTS